MLAAAGVASRRAAEDLIFAGNVKLNGQVVTAPQTLAHPQQDKVRIRERHCSATWLAAWHCTSCNHDVATLQIEVRGKVVTAQPQRKFYFAVNKPKVGNTYFDSFCLDRQLALVLVSHMYTT